MVSETLGPTKMAPRKKLGKPKMDANGALVATNASGSVTGGKVNKMGKRVMKPAQPGTNGY